MAFRTIKKTLASGQHWLGRRSTVEIVLGGAALLLAADHFTAPKGMSYVSKITTKLTGPKGLLGRSHPIPPPGVKTGANMGPGWGRGTSPYGGWALNAPAGPWPYAHAGRGHHGYDSFADWDRFGNYGWE
jgi:hypothetical protein